MALHSLIRVTILSSASVNSLEFAEMKFNLFVLLWDCESAAPMPKLEASHIV